MKNRFPWRLAAAAVLFLSLVTTSTAAPIRIMPLGDSITDGYTTPGGYRTQLWNDIVNHGQVATFVGSQYNGPSDLASHFHEGHPGWVISDIAGQVNGWIAASQPQIVLLQIGTNDFNRNVDPANAAARLNGLIDQICGNLPPGAVLYVAQITPESDPGWNAEIVNYNAQIPGIVQSKQAAGKPVCLADMYDAITTADLQEGVHPLPEGYDKLGDAWYAAIAKSLPSGGINLALGKPATASSSSTPAAFAVDGNTTSRWTANGNARPSSLTVDLGGNVAVGRTGIQFEFGDGEWYQYRIDYSTDNVNWSTFADRTNNTTPTALYVDAATVNARYLRVTTTGVQNAGDWPSIWEFQVYGQGGSTAPPPPTSALADGVYEIVARTTGNVLDCTGCSNANGTPIQLWSPWGGNCQQWAVANQGNGIYSIRNLNADGSLGRSLDCTGCNPTDGTRLELWDYWGGPCQQWNISLQSDGFYSVNTLNAKSNGTRDVLDGFGCSGAPGTPIVLWSWGGGGCQQEWSFIPIRPAALISGNAYSLTNVAAGLNLDDPNGTNVWGTKLQLFPANGTTAQQWKLNKQADGSYTLTNIAANLNLDDPNGFGQGTLQQLWPANGATAQNWKVTPAGTGSFTLTNSFAGLCLDDPAGSSMPGVNLQLWPSNGATAQQWRLTPH